MKVLYAKLVDEDGDELFSRIAPYEDRGQWWDMSDDMLQIADAFYGGQEPQ